MNSSKPYIIRALHEWISDNECTPLILVNAEHESIQIPAGIAKDGKVVLNISYAATKDLTMIDEGILFNARFAGINENIYIPMETILAMYARENGQGMMFGDHNELPEPPKTKKNKATKATETSKTMAKTEQKKAQKSFLKVVK